MRNVVVLLASLFAACSPPSSGVELVDGGASAQATPELVEVDIDGVPRLQVRGLPALSADGRTVLSLRDSDYSAELAYTEVATGVVIAVDDYPEITEDPFGEEPAFTIDAEERDALLADWAAAGFRTLTAIPRVDRLELDEETIDRFSDGTLRVEARVEPGVEGVIVVQDIASGRTLASDVDDTVDSVDAVHVAPDRSFVVVSQMFCACECAFWSDVLPLAAR